MKRIEGRMIRKSISQSKKVAKLSPEALSLFCLLIPHFNAHGKMNGNPHYIKGEIVPLIDFLNINKIIECLKEIRQHTNVKWFQLDGMYYLHSINQDEHQDIRVDRRGEDYLPDYPDSAGTSWGCTGLIQEAPPIEVEEEEEEEVKDKGSKSADFDPPLRELTLFSIKKIKNYHTALEFSASDLQRFDEVFDKLIRIDKRPPDQIREVVSWVISQTDKNKGFCWADQFQSPMKLRDKDKSRVKYFDKWLSMMRSEKKTNEPLMKRLAVKIISKDGKEEMGMYPESWVNSKLKDKAIERDGELLVMDQRNKGSPDSSPEEIKEKIKLSINA